MTSETIGLQSKLFEFSKNVLSQVGGGVIGLALLTYFGIIHFGGCS